MDDTKKPGVGAGSVQKQDFKLPHPPRYPKLLKLRQKITKKLLIAVGVAILVIVVLVVISVKLLGQHNKKVDTKKKVDTAIKDTTANLSKNNFAANDKELNDALGKATSDSQKYQILASLGASEYTQQKYDEALKNLLAAETVGKENTGSVVDSLISNIYAYKGDKKSAAAYMRKAIAVVKKTPDKGDDLQIPQFETNIRNYGETP